MVVLTEEISGDILRVVLDRPESLNALNSEILRGISSTIRDANGKYEVLIVEGNGDAFTAGADLDEASTDGENVELFQDVTRAVLEFEGIVIGKLHGWVIGGGFEWTLSFDIRYAREDTKFMMTESEVGVTISNASTLLMPLTIGAGRARELVFTGREMDVTEAQTAGLVADVFDEGDLDEEVLSVAEDIVENKSHQALVMNKRGFSSAFALDERLDYEVLLSEACDARTGGVNW
jgi:enoyl-CoA hydratase